MPRYEPQNILAGDPKALAQQLAREHRRISDALVTVNDFEASRAVGKPQEGMIRFFDPLVYSPGAVKGFYGYQDGEWKYIGPLPDLLPAEIWLTTAHGFLTLAPRAIVPSYFPVIPGSTSQMWSVDGAGIFTALARFSCNITVSCVFNVVLNANNQDINWAITHTDSGTVNLPPIGEFVSSARIVTMDISSTVAGGGLFDLGDTIQFFSDIISLTGITPTVDLTVFQVAFTNVEIIP